MKKNIIKYNFSAIELISYELYISLKFSIAK
jgi:hypothetical protein